MLAFTAAVRGIGRGLVLFWVVVLVTGTSIPAGADPLESRWGSTFLLPPKDSELQAALERILARPPFRRLAREARISVALVDMADPLRLRYAGFLDQTMRYAASLPKLAILLGAFEQVVRGRLSYTPQLKAKLADMIRYSSNPAATDTLRLIGFQRLGMILQDPRFRLYDPDRGGGLWVGKDYGGGLGYGPRDPLYGLSHGATAEQAARFLVMMDRGELVSPWASAEMKELLSQPGIRHKFVKGLASRPGVRIYRKSGTWKRWHCDAALVEHPEGRRYVAVGLVEDPDGGRILEELIQHLDDLAGGRRQQMAGR